MDHGYTNHTELIDGVVWKRFLGPEAERRAPREAAALRWATAHLPVPELLIERPGELGLRYVAGRHGQDALDEAPVRVLRRCGELAHTIGSLTPPTFLDDQNLGTVVVHGDFGPQNLLLDDPLRTVLAVLDWEHMHLGGPVEDVAWAESIVRRHHPDAVVRLDELFTGFGHTPPWPERQQAMLANCRLHLAQATNLDDPDVAAEWRNRIRWTQQLTG